MSDLISRQAAIEALGEEPPIFYDGEDEIAERDRWRRDVNAIKALPSAQPEQRWIPVSVELPASYKDVLVAYRDGTDRPGEKLNVTKAWRWDGDSRWGTDHLESISRDYEVIYWMPLPEAPEEN